MDGHRKLLRSYLKKQIAIRFHNFSQRPLDQPHWLHLTFFWKGGVSVPTLHLLGQNLHFKEVQMHTEVEKLWSRLFHTTVRYTLKTKTLMENIYTRTFTAVLFLI